MGINPVYLEESVVNQLKEGFMQNDPPSISLQTFLEEDTYNMIAEQVKKTILESEVDPLHHRFKKGPIPGGVRLLLESSEFKNIIRSIIGRDFASMEGNVCVFGWKDYKIIHDDDETPQVDIILDCTEEWDEDVGGSIVYVDGSGEYQRIPPLRNQLTIVDRKKGISQFVQYINHYATEHKRFLVVCTIR